MPPSTETGPTRDSRPGASLLAELEALDGGAPEKIFATLIEQLEAGRRYKDLFEALLMERRHQLGLPLIQVGPASEIPEDLVDPYEEAISAACSRVGALFLGDGDLAQAWPYLRAIGKTDPVREALEQIEPGTRRKDVDQLIEIAIAEGVHPGRGLEFVVHHYGICSSITHFEQVRPGLSPADQQACIAVLVRSLYDDLLENVRSEVGAHEKTDPPQLSLLEIIESRPQLFGEDSYFIDSSHLHSIVRFSPQLRERKALDLAIELAEYGSRLAPVYQYESEAPFDEYYADHALYLRGIRAGQEGGGEELDRARSHFSAKARPVIDTLDENYPSDALVKILHDLGEYSTAIELARAYEDVPRFHGPTGPGPVEICQVAGDFETLLEIGRQKDDPISFVAGLIQRRSDGSSSSTPS